ncbi:hypothetical protein Peur_007077 [Populus x canadensis]
MIMNLASKPDEQPLGCKCYKEAYSYFDNFKENAMLELSKECNLNVTPLNGDICGTGLRYDPSIPGPGQVCVRA